MNNNRGAEKIGSSDCLDNILVHLHPRCSFAENKDASAEEQLFIPCSVTRFTGQQRKACNTTTQARLGKATDRPKITRWRVPNDKHCCAAHFHNNKHSPGYPLTDLNHTVTCIKRQTVLCCMALCTKHGHVYQTTHTTQ